MKILMFGWEFPPEISGGLGTACHGLCQGLSDCEDIELTFVCPKHPNIEMPDVQFISADQIPLSEQLKTQLKSAFKNFQLIEADVDLSPYLNFKSLQACNRSEDQFTDSSLSGDYFPFSGHYNDHLKQEVAAYEIIATEIAKKQSFDIIHAHDWLSFPAALAAKKESDKPLIAHVHATEADRNPAYSDPYIAKMEKDGIEQADHVITVSERSKKTIERKFKKSDDQISVVYNGVSHFKGKTTRIKKGFKQPLVTFMGRITHQKGPEYYIDAAEKVLQYTTDVRFVMAGSGDLLPQMVTEVAKRGISNRFHFTGFLKEQQVKALLKMSDVYVMPSVSEPFGISALEALHFEVPTIISKQSGVSEVLKNAIAIDYWNTDALARAILGVLMYPTLSTLLGSAGKKEANALQWKDAAQQVQKVYETVKKPAAKPKKPKR